MNKISKTICTKIAKVGKLAAIKAAGATSAIGCYQPKEPEALKKYIK